MPHPSHSPSAMWSGLFVLLHDEERKFAANFQRWNAFLKGGDLADQYEDLILEHQEAVEQAVRIFARTSQWPEMTPQEVAVLRERLDFAIDLATLLGQASVRIPKLETRQRQIEWLLLYAWDWCGFSSRSGSFEHLRPDDILATPPLTTDEDGCQTGSA